MRIALATVLVLTIECTVNGQGEARYWYFGNYMGFDFGTEPPTILSNGAQLMLESMATISSPQGDLLFYTTGEDVFNRFHQRMPNGFSLKGSYTTSQSAIIVPKPGNPDLFYIFTADAGRYADENVEGVHYTLVSLCEQNGLGDVLTSSKNNLLLQPSAEKLSAVLHANGTDVWVVSHTSTTDEVYVWLVTEAGVQPPVISHIGHTFTNEHPSDMGGFIKFSPDGKLVAMAEVMDGKILVCDFNDSTGVVSPVKYSLAINRPYGLEFSPDGTKLYTTHNVRSLTQFNLEAGNEEDVQYSGVLIHTTFGSGTIEIDALQLAPNGKIYLNTTQFISNPNELGLACGFNAQLTPPPPPAGIQRGLSGFIQSYFNPAPQIVSEKMCESNRVNFSITHPDKVQAIVWNFGDTGSQNNTSGEINPVHTYSEEGTFIVMAAITLRDGSQFMKQKKVIVKNYSVELGPDQVICDQTQMVLDASVQEYACYRWQDGSTESTFRASSSGWHWVEVRIEGCTITDSVYLDFKQTPTLDLDPVAYLCEDSTVTLLAGVVAEHYAWSNGSTLPLTEVSEPGEYWLEVSNGACSVRDEVNVILQLYPQVTLSDTLYRCENETVEIELNEPDVEYQWSNGQRGIFTTVAEGKYWVTASINGCSSSDTLQIIDILEPISLQIDTLICEGEIITLDPGMLGSSFRWSNGNTLSSIVVGDDGIYSVNISNTCYEAELTYVVETENCDCDIFVPNVFTPNEDEFNPYFHPVIHQNITYLKLDLINRWGVSIFSTDGLDTHWDGQIEGKEASTGVYFWRIVYGCKFGAALIQKQKQGYVHLIR